MFSSVMKQYGALSSSIYTKALTSAFHSDGLYIISLIDHVSLTVHTTICFAVFSEKSLQKKMSRERSPRDFTGHGTHGMDK